MSVLRYSELEGAILSRREQLKAKRVSRFPLKVARNSSRGRTYLGTYTKDPRAASYLASHGFKVSRRRTTYVCQAPQVILLDLSNVSLPFSYGPLFPLRLWDYFKSNLPPLLRSLSDVVQSPLATITGGSRECQIRISGIDKYLLELVRSYLLQHTLDELPNHGPHIRGNPLVENFSITRCRNSVKRILRDLKRDYSRQIKVRSRRFFALYTCRKVVHHQIWKDVRRLGTNFVFNLHDGVPFGFGFMQDTGMSSQTHFAEIHLGPDPYGLHRRDRVPTPFMLKPCNPFRNAVLVDRSVSGKALSYAAGLLQVEHTLALMPKSREAIKKSDFIIFNGRLFEADAIFCDSSEWFKELYAKSLRLGHA